MAAQRLQPAVRSPVRMRGGGEDGNDGHRGNGDRVDGGDGAGDDGVGDGAGDDGVGDGDVDSDGDGDGSLLRHGRRQRTVSADECKRLKRMRAAAALKASRAARKRAREEAEEAADEGCVGSWVCVTGRAVCTVMVAVTRYSCIVQSSARVVLDGLLGGGGASPPLRGGDFIFLFPAPL